MKLAFFDVDAHLIELARAAAQSKEHAIALFAKPGEAAGEILRLFPAARLVGEWESLLVSGDFDVLVVGRSEREVPAREELLRRAVQEGVPLIAVQPAAESIVMHELAMIQKDTRSLLAAWNPSSQHPAALQIRQQIGEKPLSQVVVRRGMANVSRSAVFAQLARDAGLLQGLAGPLDRVTALGPTTGENLTSLAVTFSGTQNALIQWVWQPSSESPSGSMTVSADGQNYTLHLAPAGEPWRLCEGTSANQCESFSLGSAMLSAIENALAEDPTSPAAVDRWKEACHSAELAEAAQQSLRRGRTIQLHFEEHSEEQTFKGVMAVSGCLLLLVILLVLGLSAAIDALGLPLRNNVWWRLWPLYVLAPAVLLLAAQSLWRVFAATPNRR